jgi:hypothetical protein
MQVLRAVTLNSIRVDNYVAIFNRDKLLEEDSFHNDYCAYLLRSITLSI